MIDPKLVDNWNIVFALTHKGCGKFAHMFGMKLNHMN